MPDVPLRLDHQITNNPARIIGRLIDSYAEGVIDKAEFEPRIAGLNSAYPGSRSVIRLSWKTAEIERDLSLVSAVWKTSRPR